MAVHDNLPDSPSIGLPFGLLAVPVVLPEVLVRFEHWEHFQVQGRVVRQHAVVVMGLAQGVVLEGDAVQGPVF
jgi:hypothetical protein